MDTKVTKQAESNAPDIPTTHVGRHALLYFTHNFNTRNYLKFRALQAAFAPYGDTFTLSYANDKGVPPPIEFNAYCTDKSMLRELGYSWMHDNLMPGHTNFPAMHFAIRNNTYTSYTVIEYDVELHGAWEAFFKHLMMDPSDLIAAHLADSNEQPQWYFWNTVDLSESGSLHDAVKKNIRFFGPFFRLSAAAVKTIDEEYKKGIVGHYETLLPTILTAKGLTVRDLNEIPHPNYHGKDRWYTRQEIDFKGELNRSSMRFRPNRLFPGWRPNTLYHPVKIGTGERLASIFAWLYSALKKK